MSKIDTKISVSVVYDELSGLGRRLLQQSGLCLTHVSELNPGTQYPIYFLQGRKSKLGNLLQSNNALRIIFTDHSILAEYFEIQLFSLFANTYKRNSTDEYEGFPVNSAVYGLTLHSPFEEIGYHVDVNGNKIEGSGIIKIRIGQTQIISYPWSLSQDLESLSEHNFTISYRHNSRNDFEELGNIIDSVALRKTFFGSMREVILSAGYPYVNISFKTKEKYLCFRVDADGFSPESTDSCLQISKNLGMPFTWFINVLDWKDNLNYLDILKTNSQEIQSHGFFHIVFNSFFSNFFNIAFSKIFLAFAKVHTKGISAPLGLWNRNFMLAARSCGMKFSSEFSLGVDDLPFYPYNNSAYPLQIPSNNVSIGILEPQSGSQLISIWRDSVSSQLEDKGVAIIYDHPFQRLEKIKDDVMEFFHELKKDGVVGITFSQYYRIWNARPTLSSATVEGGDLNYELIDCEDSTVYFETLVEYPPLTSKFVNVAVSSGSIQVSGHSEGKYEELQGYSFLRFFLILVREKLNIRQ